MVTTHNVTLAGEADRTSPDVTSSSSSATLVPGVDPFRVGGVMAAATTQQQPSANIQNVLSWIVAWNSKQGSSGNIAGGPHQR